jgi:hypothetical protein
VVGDETGAAHDGVFDRNRTAVADRELSGDT